MFKDRLDGVDRGCLIPGQDPGQAIDPNTLREQLLRIAAVLGPSDDSYKHSPYLPLLGIERKYYPNNPYPSLLSYLIRGRC